MNLLNINININNRHASTEGTYIELYNVFILIMTNLMQL
jgi:hypothetical protein